MWATLGVYPLAYLPFAFVNLLNPVVSMFYGFTGITMERVEGAEGPEGPEETERRTSEQPTSKAQGEL